MINIIFGYKKNMSQTFVEETRVPVTVLTTGPSIVTQVKNKEKDGYIAVQLGFGEKSIKNVTKQLQGHLKGAIKEKIAPRFLREVRLGAEEELKVGDVIAPSDVLKEGDLVAVTSVSKGKGFAGVVKRHKFAGGPKTHGQSNRHRAPGSIGQGTTPGRVWKGKRMAGRMGSETVTVKNLTVVSVDNEKKELVLSGAIPGSRGTFVTVRKLSEGKLTDLVKKVVATKAKGKTGEVEKEAE
jgi:large subunit ribosomal protein L3